MDGQGMQSIILGRHYAEVFGSDGGKQNTIILAYLKVQS